MTETGGLGYLGLVGESYERLTWQSGQKRERDRVHLCVCVCVEKEKSLGSATIQRIPQSYSLYPSHYTDGFH